MPASPATTGVESAGRASLQWKAWLITAGVLAALAGLLAIGGDQVIRNGARRLEATWTADSVHRVSAAAQAEIESLVRSGRDYATWTDTYEFMGGGGPSYVENNLTPATFANLQIDAFLLFERDGRLRMGRTVADGVVSEVGVNELAALLAGEAREAAKNEGRLRKGIVRTPQGLAVFAVLPVLRDDGSGPPRGAHAQVRFLNEARVARIREAANLDVRLHAASGAREDRGLAGWATPESATFATRALDDQTLLVHVPWRDGAGDVAGVWHLTLARLAHQQGVEMRTGFHVVLAVLIVAAALLIGLLFRSLVIARLEVLHRAVQRVRETADLSVRLPEDGADELASLAKGINRMLAALAEHEAERAATAKERERFNRQLQQAQKLEAIGTLSGGLAHDFNNLLTSIQGSATLLRLEGEEGLPAEPHLRRIEQAVSQAASLVRQMLAFGRRSPVAFASVHAVEVIEDVRRLLRASLPRGIVFSLRNHAPNDLIRADAAQLQQVLINLATNAGHAMADGTGRLTFELAEARLPDPARPETLDATPGMYLRIAISDTGCGIPPEDLPRVFEPFFTTKPAGSGSGLGLSVAHGIIGQHRGTIGIVSAVGRGTTIILHLPKAADEPAPVGTPGSATSLGRLLLVEDDKLVRDTLAAGLRRAGYEVVVADSGPAALELIRRDAGSFDGLITDQMMAGMTGLELGQRLIAEGRRLPMFLVTGYAAALNEPTVKAMGFAAMLMKPVTIEELDRALRAARMA